MKPICRHFKIDYKQLNLFEWNATISSTGG
jgi:hypothetical protein